MEFPDQRLIAALYDGVTAPDGWNAFLELCRAELGAEAAVVAVEDGAERLATAYGSVGFDSKYRRSYDARFQSAHPWILSGLLADPPSVLSSPRHDGADFEASDFYRQ